MKKILLLFLLIPVSVSANEYSDYKEYDGNIVSENITFLNKYKYYKYEKEYGPYEEEKIQNEIFPLIDYTNYIYSDYSEWTQEIKDSDRIEKTFYKYNTVPDTNKIVFSGFSNYYNYVDITGLEVLYDGKEISFETEYFLCKNVIEDLKEKGIARVRKNSRITLNLGEKYETKKLYIKLSYISSETYPTSITIEHKNNDVINASKQYIKVQAEGETFIESISENLNIKNRDKIIYKEEKIDDGDTFIKEELFYKYRDILYLKYRQNKVYTDYLFSNPDPLNYVKDENDYKTYYKFLNIDNKIENNKKDNVLNTNEETKVVSNLIKTKVNKKEQEKNDLLDENVEPVENELTKKRNEINLTPTNLQERDYSFLYLFLIVPILFFIKIVLLLSKLYKEKKNSAIV